MLRISTWLTRLLFVFAMLAIVGLGVYYSDWFQKKVVYPFSYQTLVFQYGRENEVDPFLVAAVIRTESKFIPSARSPKGALGLMQMMPETGQWVAGQLNVTGFRPNMLIDPETSIRFGTWYLASLKKEFKGNEVLMLAAYNGGRGNVKQWMRQMGWQEDFRDISQIPFSETREYVTRVLHAKERYRDLYGR